MTLGIGRRDVDMDFNVESGAKLKQKSDPQV